MNRQTQRLLAQMLQQMEQQGASATMARAEPEQTAVVERHLAVWNRLRAVRRLTPDPRNMAAGRERMLAALAAAPRRGGGIFSRWWLSTLVRSAAVVFGLLILTGAAAGASEALGGPHIWRTVGMNRGGDGTIDRSESGGVNPAGENSRYAPDQADGSETVGEEDAVGDSESPADSRDDQNVDYVHDDESGEYNDGATSGASDDSEAGHAEGTGSSTSDDELEEEEHEERSATPNLNLTPTPKLGDRANMEYDGDNGDAADAAGMDMEVVGSGNWDNAYGGAGNEGRRSETGPAAPARLDDERPTERSDQNSARGPDKRDNHPPGDDVPA